MKSQYQAPITVREVLERVHRHDYVLPAIQREFVWDPEQIATLFDSLLRGYPVGTFLFWSVRAETAAELQFYDVVRDYHELKSPHSTKVAFPKARDVVAILDGQQRLTSFNIGLNGSYAQKVPRKRVTSPDAYPPKRLRLDLLHLGGDDDDHRYQFAFLTDEEAGHASGAHWYPVPAVLDLPDAGPSIFSYVQAHGLADHPSAFHTLARLRTAVHDDGVISYFLEEGQELDKVLDIFIRVNSGGTVLSKSDLLLSVATAQFQTLDAREEVHGLVDDLNAYGHGFSFSKDLVLKTGLVLSGVSDIAFKVENFSLSNMAVLEAAWPGIGASLRRAVKLLAGFGFSSATLKANSVLIPVTHYLHDRARDDTYLTGGAWRHDRERVRTWVTRSLIKPGIWGSGLDTLVKALRAVINDTSGDFPAAELETAMAKQGKSLSIDPALLDDLVEMPHKDKRTFAVLALLYPGVDVRNEFHIDHVFPRSLFTPTRLQAAGIPAERIPEMRARFDLLPNLQLLEGPVNEAKRNKLPHDWVVGHLPNAAAREGWLAMHDLHDLPVDLDGFLALYESRRLRMRARIAELLGEAEATLRATVAQPAPISEPAPRSQAAPPSQPAPTAQAAPTFTKSAFRQRQSFDYSLADLVELGILQAGTEVHGLHRGVSYRAVIRSDGTLEHDGDIYATPSQAARLVSHQAAVNGWLFWRLDDGTPIGDLRPEPSRP